MPQPRCRASREPIAIGFIALVVLFASGCGRFPLQEYEYEEEMTLSLDGSATLQVSASVPALVALRGFDLDVSPTARLDRATIRTLYASPVIRVGPVRTSRRRGRRFVHIRMDVDDVRRLASAAPFAWSSYRLERVGDLYVFNQIVGRSAGRSVGDVGWTGREFVAFRVHLPSKIQYHDAPSKKVGRGNILVWEQPLRERLADMPLRMEARMETESILYRTIALFAGTLVAVVLVLTAVIWWIVRKGAEPSPTVGRGEART